MVLQLSFLYFKLKFQFKQSIVFVFLNFVSHRHSINEPGDVCCRVCVVDEALHLEGLANAVASLQTDHEWSFARFYCNSNEYV